MALSASRKIALAKLSLPDSDSLRTRTREYLARTGLSVTALAKRINYADSSLRHWLRGTYHLVASRDDNLRAALAPYLDAHPIAVQDHAEGKLYRTRNVEIIEECFRAALDRGRIFVIEAPPGTQKTYPALHLVAELNRIEACKNGSGRRTYYVYCRAKITPMELMREMAISAGIHCGVGLGAIIRNIRAELANRRALFILDEAQHLSIACLETVRELFDRPPYIGLLFMGSHAFGRIFDTHGLHLEQLRRRIRGMRVLPGLSEDEARQIIGSELGAQPDKKIAELIRLSQADDLYYSANAGRAVKYISAGNLFDAVDEIKEKLQAREGGEA